MRLALQVLELDLKLNLDLNQIWVSRTDPRLQKSDAMTKQVKSYIDIFRNGKNPHYTENIYSCG
jgi:hypothetical protein